MALGFVAKVHVSMELVVRLFEQRAKLGPRMHRECLRELAVLHPAPAPPE